MTTNKEAAAAFPADLAEKVTEEWSHFVSGDYSPPQLPNAAQLRELFETSYFAGMETDEARPLRFMLCCSSGLERIPHRVGAEPIESWEIYPERPFNVQEIRRIAAVADLDASAIWIRFTGGGSGKLMIRGLVNLGRSWAVARNAFSYHYDELPHTLTVRVTAPGRMVIYQSAYRMASLAGGKLEIGGLKIAQLDLLGIDPLLDEGRSALRDLINAPEEEDVGQWHSFESLAYINCILAILNGMQLAGHGGALILTGQHYDIVKSDCVKIKYGLASGGESLKNHFIEFMNARHTHGNLVWLSEWQNENAPTEQEITLASYPLRGLQEKVAQACAFVGSLAGTDGAIVLRTDLVVVGFGTEIVLDKVDRPEAFEVDHPMQKEDLPVFDTEQRGMRHRSAIRLCGTESNLAVFVVSQDGGVSLVWSKDDKVFFKPGISTTNINMPIA